MYIKIEGYLKMCTFILCLCIIYVGGIMYIQRQIENTIKEKLENYRKPLCILGARQVGKSTVVKYCLKDYKYVYINMFDTPGIREVFSEHKDLSVSRIITELQILLGQEIDTDTIIAIDEIQSSPVGLASLKSFNEDGKYKVIALGSNLGSFLLHKTNYSFPVGQYSKINMYPISFTEFLNATQNNFFLQQLKSSLANGNISDILHKRMLEFFDIYMSIGGMPEVVKAYLQGEDSNQLELIKEELVNGYLNDFGKYEFAIENAKALNVIYRSIPRFLNKDNQKFIFSEINYEYKQLVNSFKWLNSNNYVHLVPQINSQSLPLIANAKDSQFKLFANETSLVMKQANYKPLTVLKERDKIYYGFVMENYIATVLNKYQTIYTYRKERTEIDFMYENDNQLYAFEVKSGGNTRSKSLNALKNSNPDVIAVKLSRNNLRIDSISNIPLYAIDYVLEEDKLLELINN